MRVAVVLEHRFIQASDGAAWSQTMFSYRFWQRYLTVFDEVLVMARATIGGENFAGCHRVDGPGVRFVPLPYYIGPAGYLRQRSRIRQTLRNAIRPEDAVILRVPSALGELIRPTLLQRGQPYAVEVVGDPYQVLAAGAIRHPFRPILRQWYGRTLRGQCREAAAAAYVTQQALQHQYPPRPGTLAIGCSDVELPEEAFAVTPRVLPPPGRIPRLLIVGSLAQRYKAVDVLLQAISIYRRQWGELTLAVIGDGQIRGELEKQTRDLGLADVVTFLGSLASGRAVREQLDESDLFVLPSRTEGLPRALVEAMARGLPCIASTVGGIPELLPAEDLAPPDDAASLAGKIREIVANPERQRQMSARNLEEARKYHNDALNRRRDEFYRHVRTISEKRLAGRAAA